MLDAPDRRVGVTGLAVLLLASCSDADVGPAPEYPRLIATEELRIGSVDDPETALTRILAIAVGPEGRIYSLHDREQTIRVHARDGTPIGRFGGEGEGPGEFLAPGTLDVFENQLVVYDTRTSRASYFDFEGRLVEETTFRRTIPEDRRWSSYRADGVLPDGTFFGQVGPSAVRGGWEVDTNLILRFRSDGSILDTLATRGVEHSRLLLDLGDEPIVTVQRFQADPIHAVSAARAELVMVDRAIRASRAEFAVTKVEIGGDAGWRREYSYQPIELEPAVIDTFVTTLAGYAIQSGVASSRGEIEAEIRRQMYIPPHLPPVESVVAGTDGTVFLELADSDPAGTKWMMLRSDGDVIGLVELPDRFLVRTGTATEIWGQDQDSLDVPYLVKLSVTPAARRLDPRGVFIGDG